MRKIVHYIFYALLLSFFLNSCTFSIKGEGKIEEKEIKLRNINKLLAKGNYRLIYLYDDKNPRLIIETYKNLINNLNINNAGGELSISESRNVENTDLYNIYVYNSIIEKFELHDHVNIEINSQLKIPKLTLKLYDNSKFLGNNLIINNFIANLEDNSKVNVQGEGTHLKIKVKDNSDFSAIFFSTSDAHVQLSGVATSELNVKNKITGKITENSSLTLLGNPAKDIKQEELAKLKEK